MRKYFAVLAFLLGVGGLAPAVARAATDTTKGDAFYSAEAGAGGR